MTTLLVLLGIAAAILLYGITLYNNLVTQRNRVRNGFAQIDVQLTRRHDLIPNLVEAVKGYMAHERETLQGVISQGLVPAGRWGSPGDVGRAVASAVSGAFDFSTGAVIAVDGGLGVPAL